MSTRRVTQRPQENGNAKSSRLNISTKGAEMMHIAKKSIVGVTRYDRTNGFVISAIMIVGFLVSVLFLIWCTQEFRETRSGKTTFPARPMPLTDVSLDQDDLDLSEFPPAAAPKFNRELTAVSETISTIRGDEAKKSIFESDLDSQGSRRIGPVGNKDGERGPPGPAGPLPDYKRWSVRYDNTDFENYVQLLRFFNIEIGIVSLNDNEILRIELDNENPNVVVSNRKTEEDSFYFLNEKSTSRRWDQKIARDSNIDVADSFTVHFYPEETLEILRRLEADRVRSDGKETEDVFKSRFQLFQTDSGFEIRLLEISYQ